MTTLFAENFTDQATGATSSLNNSGWASENGSAVTTSSTQRRTGVNSFQLDYNESVVRSIAFGGTEFFFSFAFRLVVMPTGGNNLIELFALLDSNDATMFEVEVSNAGEYRLISNGVAYISSGAGVIAGVWYWVQGKLVVSDTVGSVELRDGSGNTIRVASNIDTKPGTPTAPSKVRVGSTNQTSTNADGFLTDLHIWDSTGSICNTWTTATQIDNFYPNAAGGLTQWTPSTGANWECVDEVPLSTTDYVYADAEDTTTTDLYNFQNLTETPTEIYALVVSAAAFKDNAGPGNIELLADSGSGSPSTASSSSLALPANGYARVFYVRESDPGTGAAWDATGFNNAQFGIRVAA